MEILRPELTWRRQLTPLNLNIVDGIALHHMAHPTWGLYDVQAEHLQRDVGTWSGIGYNYWIDYDGNIYECRGLNQGAGVEFNNSHLISIGFQGDYHSNPEFKMPDAQFNAGVQLIKHLVGDILPGSVIVEGHKFWNATGCPGDYFPLDEMKTLQERGTASVWYSWKEIINKVADNPEPWIKVIEYLQKSKISKVLSILKYLPDLIEKIYNKAKRGEI